MIMLHDEEGVKELKRTRRSEKIIAAQNFLRAAVLFYNGMFSAPALWVSKMRWHQSTFSMIFYNVENQVDDSVVY